MNTKRTAAALAAALLLAAPARPQETPPAPPAPPTTPAPAPSPRPAPPTPEEDKALLESLMAKAVPLVEKARGLKFKKPVPVAPVTVAQFIDRYERDFTRILGGAGQVEAASRLLARLHVLKEGDNLRAMLSKFLEGNIAANYDPESGGVSFLPGARRTILLMVHELTHALDDQHFDMKTRIASWTGSFDRALAYGALAEGDAESVEFRLMSGGAVAQQPLENLRAFADAQAEMVLKGKFGATPPALVLAFKTQYLEGAIFAETLRRSEKAEEAINAAFREPPASTEQILHPEKFLAGEAPVSITLPGPTADGKVAFATNLGELGVRLVLLANGRDAKEAAAVAAGWGGDTVALVTFPAGDALVWSTAWDTEEDATAFHDAMKAAFPVETGEESAKVSRVLVQRGTTVEYVEAPLDALAPAVAMAKGATRK